ncbi:SBBP repeat-containing protein [Niabella yanshanensis]
MGRSGLYNGSTTWYHDLTSDREGNIYVGDMLGNSTKNFKR